MFDFMLDRVGAPYWVNRLGKTVKFHREYSRCITDGAAAITAPTINVFDYSIGDNAGLVPALLNLIPAGANVTKFDTSILENDHVNESYWATHLRIAVQVMTDAAVIVNDNRLVQADYEQLVARTRFELHHEKQSNIETEGFLHEFPAGEGDYVESTNANYYNAVNGPNFIQAARPLPKPLMYWKASTFLRGTFYFGTDRGNIALANETGLRVYLDGFRYLTEAEEPSGMNSKPGRAA